MSDSFALGPFHLKRCLATGGMGAVWLAEHGRSGTPVAVKVLTSRRARDARFRADFRREVATLARLSHPNIIPILEHGVVKGAEAEASHGKLQAGAPYLVTEYARGGSLYAREGPMPWAEQVEVIRSVLCALGHAHARGVIHRDLKPGNILLPAASDPYPLVRLADFGIVHAMHQRELEQEVQADAESLQRTAGTPGYMSPEQFTGRWHLFGPWTDLYALGALVWQLTTGHLPFQGEEYSTLALQHLDKSLPAYTPVMDVPPGLEAWLRRLLRKAHAQRYDRARDALRAFDELCGASRASYVTGQGSVPESSATLSPTVQGESGASSHDPTLSDVEAVDLEAVNQEAEPGTAEPLAERSAAPTFRELRVAARRLTRLVEFDGVGSSLLHLRVPSLVGREVEREALWRGLQEVVVHGGPRLLVLQGGVGVGKSRLSRWLGETAHEEGVANVLSLRAEPGDVPGQSIARALGNELRCEGLAAPQALKRVEEWLREHGEASVADARPLLELLLEAGVVSREGVDRLPPLTLSGGEERFALFFRVLQRLQQERVLVVEVEDVHHDASLAGTVSALLTHAVQGCSPCFVVMTLQTVASTVPSLLAPALEELRSTHGDREERVEVALLTREVMLELLQDSLGLKGVVAVEIAEHSAGNPQLAVELVRDLVRRHQLREEGGALVLRGGGAVQAPETLRSLLRAPLVELGRASGVHAIHFLELAAVLGHRFEEALWHRMIVRALPHVDRGPLLDELSASGVLEPDGDRQLRFAHAVQRELLIERCRERYRWGKWNGLAAELLAGAAGEQELVRLARHQEEAGRLEQAAESYLQAMRASVGRRDVTDVASLLERLERVLNVLSVPEGDVLWLEGWLQVMKAGQWTWNVPLCRELALKTLQVVNEEEQPRYAAEAYRALVFAQGRGVVVDYPTLQLWAEKSVWLSELSGDGVTIVRALEALSTILRETGRMVEAGDHLKRAQEVLGEYKVDEAIAGALQASLISKRALLAQEYGKNDEAEELFDQAALAYDALGARHRMLKCRMSQLAAARENGADPEIVEVRMREILEARKALSLSGWLVTQVNLGFALCLNHKFEEALELLLECHPQLERQTTKRFDTIATTFLLLALAGAGRVEAWAEEFDRVESALQEKIAYHVEGATALEKAAELLYTLGHVEHARRSMRLAHLQWSELGHEEQATRCGDWLEGLSTRERSR